MLHSWYRELNQPSNVLMYEVNWAASRQQRARKASIRYRGRLILQYATADGFSLESLLPGHIGFHYGD